MEHFLKMSSESSYKAVIGKTEHTGYPIIDFQCFRIDGQCFVPATRLPCHVGQAQVGTVCVEVPNHTIALPVDACGFDISLVGALLIVKITQCFTPL